ncbi:MAG TPA: hypothetical protein VN222_09670, partial [Novosphingobium sp.]|nr:hypothetical protein [Novosphingobium sp.]
RRRSERARTWDRLVWAAVLGLAVVNLAANVWLVESNANVVGALRIGEPGTLVRYHLGGPVQVMPAGVWRYRPQGALLDLRFDAQGRLAGVACIDERPDPLGCPTRFGVAVGSSEQQVLAALGRPTYRLLREGEELIAYDGIGLRLRLRGMSVVAMESRAPGSLWSRLAIAGWRMLP